MYQLDGKVVIVTGGGSGIGFGISQAFAEEGAKLVLTGRTLSKLENAKNRLEKDYNAEVLVVAADGGREEDVANVIRQTVETFGKVDAIVNNAQNSASGTLLADHSKEDFDKAVFSGLYATFFYMKHGFEELKKTKGSVINFASGAGLSGKSGQSSYAAAKEGIRGMSRVAATEWGEFGINVNVICPLVMTEALEQWRAAYPELYEQTIQAIPMRRFADAKGDIGRLCCFLASDDAAYITGESITVQGGSGLRP